MEISEIVEGLEGAIDNLINSNIDELRFCILKTQAKDMRAYLMRTYSTDKCKLDVSITQDTSQPDYIMVVRRD